MDEIVNTENSALGAETLVLEKCVQNDNEHQHVAETEQTPMADCRSLAEDKSSNAKKKPVAVKDGEYSDPVYKKISLINGEINRMTKNELKTKLEELRMDARGVKEVLKKRLKSYYKRQKLTKARIKTSKFCRYDYLLVIDFEATCEENNTNYQHEIIEFPIVMIDTQKQKIVEEFHKFCKPRINRRLSEFCSVLTGISQETVDKADEFPLVLQQVEEWMKNNQLCVEKKFAIATDGPWDVSRFLYPQCCLSNVKFPKWARKWINIRKTYANFYQRRRCKLEVMLSNMGMQFEGQLHSGLHDSRNIARIVIHMLEDGCKIRENEYLQANTSHLEHSGNVEVGTITREQDSDSDETGDGSKSRSPQELSSTDSTAQKTRSSDNEELQTSLEALKLTDKSNGKEEDNDIDDLLSYYKNQKS